MRPPARPSVRPLVRPSGRQPVRSAAHPFVHLSTNPGPSDRPSPPARRIAQPPAGFPARRPRPPVFTHAWSPARPPVRPPSVRPYGVRSSLCHPTVRASPRVLLHRMISTSFQRSLKADCHKADCSSVRTHVETPRFCTEQQTNGRTLRIVYKRDDERRTKVARSSVKSYLVLSDHCF